MALRHLNAAPVLTLVASLVAASLSAQADRHAHHPDQHPAAASAGALPTLPGQDAFGAIAEVVRLLEADPATDWTRASLERLRSHLVDMHDVTLGADVRSRSLPGGAEFEATGTGRTVGALQRMARAHAAELGAGGPYRVAVADLPAGIRFTVTAVDPADEAAVARIRGLGFIGLLTVGNHHAAHHLMLARGDMPAGH